MLSGSVLVRVWASGVGFMGLGIQGVGFRMYFEGQGAGK